MSASVFAFPNRAKGPQPWSNDELAELYRVIDLLGRAGLSVISDMGMSDEGDPWFVFCRADNGDVIAHFARIDGVFVAASIAVDETFRGANFRQIVDRMVSSQPLVVPPPTSGSRLLLHPAVLLTAFVATALAHSEKLLVQDWLNSVEAIWDHGKQSALHELKQIKTGWTDTLASLLKLPIHEARVSYDSAKEGLSMTLASLIAIAFTALQPIAEKIAAFAQIVEHLPDYAESTHQSIAHAASVAFDAPVSFESDNHGGNGHGEAVHHGDAELPLPQKMAAIASDVPAAEAKSLVDAAHQATPVVQKAVASGEPVPHLTIDTQFDGNIAAVAAQKVIAMAASQPSQPTESLTVHFDLVNSSLPALDLQNLTPDAIHLLELPSGNKTTVSQTTDGPDGPTLKNPDPPLVLPGAPQPLTSPTPVTPVVVSTPPTTTTAGGNIIIDVSAQSDQVVSAISDFVSSGKHNVTPQIAFSDPVAQAELAGLVSVYGTVKVVFFDGTNSPSEVFLYSPGVVFVDERSLASSSHVANSGGDLILEGVSFGTMTLVGVATVGHSGLV